MLKTVVAATAALAIAGSSLVYAQQRFGGDRGFGGPRAEHRHQRSPEDVAAFTDARIAALKAGLELTPDQSRYWPAFEQALRDMSQLRIARMQARQAQQGQQGQTPATPFDRMARRSDNMAKTSAALKKVADTGAPLYASLTDAQKGRFTQLARMLRPHHRGQGGNDGRNGGWRQGQGYGRDGRDGGGWRQGEGYGRGGDGGYGHHRFGQDRGGMRNLSDDDSQGSQL